MTRNRAFEGMAEMRKNSFRTMSSNSMIAVEVMKPSMNDTDIQPFMASTSLFRGFQESSDLHGEEARDFRRLPHTGRVKRFLPSHEMPKNP